MRIFLFLVTLLSFSSYAQIDLSLKSGNSNELVFFLWSLDADGDLEALKYSMHRANIIESKLDALSELKVHILDKKYLNKKGLLFVEAQENSSIISFIASRPDLQGSARLSSKAIAAIKKYRKNLTLINQDWKLSARDLKDIIHYDSTHTTYGAGSYDRTVRLFLICRKNRAFPCMFIMKDIFGDLVREPSGELWTLPALAKSKRDISYNKTNGHTPAGIHSMDSVMPEANRVLAFGKFRRVILNWIKNDPSQSELFVKDLLPSSQYIRHWWKRASVARDVGRKYLRIHGTGKINTNNKSTYYPHMPTSGCISTREGQYPQALYQDQSIILQKLLEASQLSPVFSNETKIKGILYVLDLDDKKQAVSIKDLNDMGIL